MRTKILSLLDKASEYVLTWLNAKLAKYADKESKVLRDAALTKQLDGLSERVADIEVLIEKLTDCQELHDVQKQLHIDVEQLQEQVERINRYMDIR